MYNLFVIAQFFSAWHIIIIVLAVLILFGGKKIKETMKGFGEGIKEFKKGMKDTETEIEEKKENDNPLK